MAWIRGLSLLDFIPVPISDCQRLIEPRVIYWITLALSYCGILSISRVCWKPKCFKLISWCWFYTLKMRLLLFGGSVASRQASSFYLDVACVWNSPLSQHSHFILCISCPFASINEGRCLLYKEANHHHWSSGHTQRRNIALSLRSWSDLSRFLGQNACGFLLRVSGASMLSCCYFSKPVVYITRLFSGVDRQSESAEISLSTYLPISNVFGAFLEEEKPSIKLLSLTHVSSYGKHSQWRL